MTNILDVRVFCVCVCVYLTPTSRLLIDRISSGFEL